MRPPNPSRRRFLRRTAALPTPAVAGVAGCLDRLTSPSSPAPARPRVAWRHTVPRARVTNVGAVARLDGGLAVAETVGTGDSPDDWAGVLTIADSNGVETLHRTEGRRGYVARDVVPTDDGVVYAGVQLDAEGRLSDTWITAVDADGTERWRRRLDGTAVWLVSAERPGEVRVFTSRADGTTLQFSRVTVASGHVDRRWTAEGPQVVTDVMATADGLLVGGRTSAEDGVPVVDELTAGGERSRRQRYDEDLPFPRVVLADDPPGQTVALNGLSGTFTADFRLLALDSGADWRVSATGWHVAGVHEPPDWPDLGRHRLVVAHRAGEQPADDTGAQLFAVDDAGRVRWRTALLTDDAGDRWRLRAAASADAGLLVAGELGFDSRRLDLGVARLEPRDSGE
jgi:hypothetical protein